MTRSASKASLRKNYSDRALAELEAESTAYVVCRSLGLDSSDYSLGYVSTWAGGGDAAIAAIKASGERIQKTAAQILRLFDGGRPATLELRTSPRIRWKTNPSEQPRGGAVSDGTSSTRAITTEHR